MRNHRPVNVVNVGGLVDHRVLNVSAIDCEVVACPAVTLELRSKSMIILTRPPYQSQGIILSLYPGLYRKRADKDEARPRERKGSLKKGGDVGGGERGQIYSTHALMKI